jgi:Zn finger protein HypA/HybF involved in hydrogenase expression
MHEQAMLEDLIRKVGEVSRTEGAGRVKRVRLWVGALSHLTGAELQEHWSLVTQGTPAEGSVLEVVVSQDPGDPRAQGVVLTSVDLEGPEVAGPS